MTRKVRGASCSSAAVASSTEVSRGRKLGSNTKRLATAAALKTAARDDSEMAQAMPPATTAPAAGEHCRVDVVGAKAGADAAAAGVGELALAVGVAVHQVDALLPGPELQQGGGNAEFHDPGGDRLAEVVVGQYGQQAHAGAGSSRGGGNVEGVTGNAELGGHAVGERHVGGHLNEDLAHHHDVERGGGFVGLGCSPVMHRSVEPPVDGQVFRVEREAGGGFLVELHADAGGVPGVHVAVVEGVGRGEYLVGRLPVAHVFLDAEVGDAHVHVQGRGEGRRREIARAVRAGAHAVEVREGEDPAQVRDAAGVRNGGADVVDEPFGDQLLAVPDRVEHLAHRDGRGGVLADQAERRLVLGRRRVLDPERPVLLQRRAQPAGLDRRQAVVHVVQDVHAVAELFADVGHHLRREVQVGRGLPGVLLRDVAAGRLVHLPVHRRDAVGLVQAGDRGLDADGLVAEVQVVLEVGAEVLQRGSAGVAVDHDALAGRTAEELVDRHAGGLALDVPQRDVDGGDRRHGHRSAAPVGALVEVLPGVLDPARVAADQQRAEVLGQVGRHGQLAAVEGGVADAGDAVLGFNNERDVVPSGRRNHYPCVGDLHWLVLQVCGMDASR